MCSLYVDFQLLSQSWTIPRAEHFSWSRSVQLKELLLYIFLAFVQDVLPCFLLFSLLVSRFSFLFYDLMFSNESPMMLVNISISRGDTFFARLLTIFSSKLATQPNWRIVRKINRISIYATSRPKPRKPIREPKRNVTSVQRHRQLHEIHVGQACNFCKASNLRESKELR